MLMRQHVNDAGNLHRLADVDRDDATFGDRTGNDIAVQEIGGGVLGRVFRTACNFKRAIDAARRTPDIGNVAVMGHH